MNKSPMTEEELSNVISTLFRETELAPLTEYVTATSFSNQQIETYIQSRGVTSTPLMALALEMRATRLFVKALSGDMLFDARFAAIYSLLLEQQLLETEIQVNRTTLLQGIR